MTEDAIGSFWDAHPCGEHMVGGVGNGDYVAFFDRYDAFRYGREGHILRCLDELDLEGLRVLEIGLGLGADSEQIVRRGARWSGVDLTPTSVDRVRTRMEVRGLSYEDIRCGSALELPFEDGSFDLVFSHGVLHHIPEIQRAQQEIHRVLVPGGRLVAMLYARRSLNYLLSISVIRRIGLVGAVLVGRRSGIVGEHVRLAEEKGLVEYLRMRNFLHRNTDGPHNPFSRVYGIKDVERDFPGFAIERVHREFLWAPPLPVQGLPGASVLGWHLWVHLRAL